MKRILGIDLGTTTTAAALMDGDEVRIIPNNRGARLTPSIVAFTQENEILIGESAKNQSVINAEGTVQCAKREIGTDKKYNINGALYTPVQISSYILKKIKRDAEEHTGEVLDDAVITVPANFTENQRRATVEAGKKAGLKVRRIINEPTAAALAYAYRTEGNSNILVYDLGGGTFDVTYLKKQDQQFTVQATCGDNHLGGMDFDESLIREVTAYFKQETGIQIEQDPILYQQLRDQVENAKIELSSRESALIAMPFVGKGNKPVHLQYTITRKQLENLIGDYLQKTIELSKYALQEAGSKPEDVSLLILSGGSSRIPLVNKKLKETFGTTPVRKINPEEVVAYGAGIEARLLEEESSPVFLQDVTSFTVGVEIDGGKAVPLIKRNTAIPARSKQLFTTISDNQESVEIHVLQGETQIAQEAISLGRFYLSGIRKGKKGQPRIEVEFHLNIDGMVEVLAVDLDTGATQQVTMVPTYGVENGNNNGTERLSFYVRRAEEYVERFGNALETDFRSEVKEIVDKAQKIIKSKDDKKIGEYEIALEALICELEEYAEQQEDSGYGRA